MGSEPKPAGEAITAAGREIATRVTGDPVPGELARTGPTREVLRPLDADDVAAAFDEYQALLPRLLDSSDYITEGDRRFVKKSGWRKIARAFNLTVELVRLDVTRDKDGGPERAEAVARAIAPNGVAQDGDGYCSIEEERFRGERGRLKAENDLRATATTRAKNRAIADLVGMGEVSAEEVDGGQSGGAAPAAADPELEAAGKRALGYIVGDSEVALELWTAAYAAHGAVATKGLCELLIAAREHVGPGPEEGKS